MMKGDSAFKAVYGEYVLAKRIWAMCAWVNVAGDRFKYILLRKNSSPHLDWKFTKVFTLLSNWRWATIISSTWLGTEPAIKKNITNDNKIQGGMYASPGLNVV